METHSKYYWVIVGVAALAVLGTIFVLSDYLAKDAAISPDQVKKAEEKARLLIDFGDGKKRAFRGEVTENMTVYGALVAVREAAGLSFSLKGDAVEEIDGVKNNSHEWHYYVNGEPVKTSPQFEEVDPGDEITFKFE
ncbi:MAG: DUF4430 domain-containing protein [bacterium]|nr:DUF4430 domain-containing protein [bacterium]